MSAANDALAQLMMNTVSFMENNALVIYGCQSKSGAKDFVLQGTDDNKWRSCAGGGMKEVPMWVIYAADTFNGKARGEKSNAFNAHYISMREYDAKTNTWEDADTTHYTLPSTGTRVMVTSKINGCTFGIGSDADGARIVSHLRPPTALGPVTSRTELDKGTRGGFVGGKLDVSVMSSTEQNGTVFARRAEGAWTFYVQRFRSTGGSGIIDQVNTYT